MEETTLEVDGMSCGGCEKNVRTALEALEGVSSATADHTASEVRVTHDETLVDRQTLSGTIEDAGYEVAG
ncbi:cation transporter [Halobacteria archaeon AArc-m2/3/4]|uniref:Cation transporter n=1 Tax=Natronoglomus mannanivorans TaxID=2979990 RepID=A0AAP2Z1K3_9EURY|nr:cation transporter [Halobacteria archaeon AArc-xg1-1]MCU4974828.1 cation transporter [Halobacteria archaeon AArc-m2/3/4]